MTWNYRVIYHSETYTIRAVYYDENGDPKAVGSNPCYPSGETLEELELDLANYMMALTKPVLNYEDFQYD